MVSSRKHGLRHVIGVNWADIHQPCPRFDRFVHEVLPDPDVRRLVQQYVGYTLIGDTRYQVGQWWIGAGSNGKGVLALLVSALHRKTAAVSLDDLHGFGLESALAASLITVDETPPQIDEQRLKTLISGDEIVINRKFMRAVTARFRAKWLVRGNLPPALRDHSNGAWRRWHIIPFTAEFGPGQQEPGLADYMIQHELAGILRWALDGLVMLLKAGGFKDTPEAVQQATRAMQAQTDSVAAWFEDADIRFNDDKQTPKDTVYAGYVGWCKSNGMLPVASNKFWDRLSTYAKRHGQALVMSRPRAQGRRGVTNLDLGGDEAQGQPDRVAVVVPFRKPPTSDPVPVVQPDAALEGFVDLDKDDLDAAPVVQTGPLTADTIKVPEFAAHHTGGIIPRRPPKPRPDGSGGVR
jgi:putative DNA primase/helicase